MSLSHPRVLRNLYKDYQKKTKDLAHYGWFLGVMPNSHIKKLKLKQGYIVQKELRTASSRLHMNVIEAGSLGSTSSLEGDQARLKLGEAPRCQTRCT